MSTNENCEQVERELVNSALNREILRNSEPKIFIIPLKVRCLRNKLKNKKNLTKHLLGCKGRNWSKNRKPRKAHLLLLLIFPTEFQLLSSSSIRRRNIRRTALFHGQKIERRRLIFDYVTQLWIFYRSIRKGTIFTIFTSQHPLPQIWARLDFDRWLSPLKYM